MFRIQSDDSIICGLYLITCIENMIAGKMLLDYTNFFSWKTKHDKIVYKYFKDKYGQVLTLD